MADRIGKAVLEIEVDDRQYRLAMSDLPRSAGRAGTDATRSISRNLNLAIFTQLASAATNAIGRIASTIVDLGVRGAAISDVAGAFGVLSAKTGETADVMLGSLREGVRGTIADTELMTMANRALGAGLVRNRDDMATLASGARALGKQAGVDTAQAFNTLTSAIAGGRTTQLRQLGIFVDSKRAVEEYAAAQGISVSAMTDADRAAALSAAAMEALRQRMEEIPPAARDFGEMIEAAKAQLKNFTDGIAVGIANSPVLAAGMNAMGEALSQAFGGDQSALITAIVHGIETLAIGIARVAGVAVSVGSVVYQGFQAIKIGLNTILAAIFSGIQQAGVFIQDLMVKASGLPVVGEGFRQMAGGIQTTIEVASILRENFQGLADDQATNTVAMVDNFGRVRGVIDSVAQAMTDARDEAERSGQGVVTSAQQIAAGASEAAASTGVAFQQTGQHFATLNELSASNAVAIEARFRQLQNQLVMDNASGIEQRLAQLAVDRQTQLAGLQELGGLSAEQYAVMTAMINAHYEAATQAAQGHYQNVQQAAEAAGFKTRSELQQNAERAQQTYTQMLASGLYTERTLEAAHRAAVEAMDELNNTSAENRLRNQQAVLQGSADLLGQFAQRHKAFAIAQALINTYLAVSQAWRSVPFPFNIPLAAAALAGGLAQVNQIRAQDAGFKEGTPGLDFMNFGAESWRPLHGSEAVIPQGGGHLLASEIASALPGAATGGGEDLGGKLDHIADVLEGLPRDIKRGFREAVLAT